MGTQLCTHLEQIRNSFESRLGEIQENTLVQGGECTRLPHTSLVTFPNCPADTLLIGLDIRGIRVSAGSACSSGAARYTSSVLQMGQSKLAAASTLRFSFGATNTLEDVEATIAALKELVPLGRANSTTSIH
jgi:cysteine desulfurase